MIATSTSQLLWYTTRATGIVALVLLTACVVLGVLTSVRYGTRSWPRFAFQDLHRRFSLLAVVFVALHVITTVSDAFAPIGWVSVVIPFVSPYRRLWLGLGTVSVDVLLAVTISSMLRQRINPRTWRALHWLGYASWPLAVVHGLGTGTDPHLGWVMVLVVGCVAVVLCAVGWRLVAGWPARSGGPGDRWRDECGGSDRSCRVDRRPVPLRPGWAARAGTPPALLAALARHHRSSAPRARPRRRRRHATTPPGSPLSRHAPGNDHPAQPFERFGPARDQGADLGERRRPGRHRDRRARPTGRAGWPCSQSQASFGPLGAPDPVPGPDRRARRIPDPPLAGRPGRETAEPASGRGPVRVPGDRRTDVGQRG